VSFNYADPTTSDKDQVRFLLQDTNSSEPFMQDEEINFMLSKWKDRLGSVEYVAAACAEVLAARYAREASISADGVNIGLGVVAQQFRELAASLRQQHKSLLVGGFPDVGGITPYEEQDPNIAPFNFGTGMHDDLAAGRQEYGSRDFYSYNPYEEPGT